jgi:phosphatidylglycerophosphatase A
MASITSGHAAVKDTALGDGSLPDTLLRRPTWRWMLSHPARYLALGFGSGLVPFAPGTWGTLFAWVSFVVLDVWLTDAGWWTLIVATALIGAAAADRTGRDLGRADHPAIVVDEVVAFWIVLLVLPDGVLVQAAAFVAFRFFDIVKPPPIGFFDRRFKHGIGVMVDDLIAAFYTLLAAALIVRIAA